MLLAETITDTLEQVLDRIERGGKTGLPPPILNSCLIDPDVTPELTCKEKWLPDQIDAFRSELFPVLEQLACESSAIAGGLIRQIDRSETTGELFWLLERCPLSPSAEYATSETTSGRFGLAGRFAALLDQCECKGLTSLSEAEKDRIRELAKEEEEERRRQSAAGKPAEEVPASPTPPPAIAPQSP